MTRGGVTGNIVFLVTLFVFKRNVFKYELQWGRWFSKQVWRACSCYHRQYWRLGQPFVASIGASKEQYGPAVCIGKQQKYSISRAVLTYHYIVRKQASTAKFRMIFQEIVLKVENFLFSRPRHLWFPVEPFSPGRAKNFLFTSLCVWHTFRLSIFAAHFARDCCLSTKCGGGFHIYRPF